MEKVVVIVAGGSGSRMGNELPKQFIEINGLPILMHTINKFYSFDQGIEIRLVLPERHFRLWNDLVDKHQYKKPHSIYPGGNNRFESVKSGLTNIKINSLVAIHDGVRPFVSHDVISRGFKTAQKTKAAIPVIDVFETLRAIKDQGSITVDRNKYKLVQTPQVFSAELLFKAYQQSYNEKFTDDASVIESYGTPVALFEGNRENIKITTPIDLKLAKTFL